MAVCKRKYRRGKTVWCFVIDAPGSTQQNRRQLKESGFATKAAARNCCETSSRSTPKENWRRKP